MLKPRKRWVCSARSQQLSFDWRNPRLGIAALLHFKGARWIASACVALLVGILIHPHLFLVLVPTAFVLAVQALVEMQRSTKRGGVAVPLKWISLVHGREIQESRRPKKYIQLRLGL